MDSITFDEIIFKNVIAQVIVKWKTVKGYILNKEWKNAQITARQRCAFCDYYSKHRELCIAKELYLCNCQYDDDYTFYRLITHIIYRNRDALSLIDFLIARLKELKEK